MPRPGKIPTGDKPELPRKMRSQKRPDIQMYEDSIEKANEIFRDLTELAQCVKVFCDLDKDHELTTEHINKMHEHASSVLSKMLINPVGIIPMHEVFKSKLRKAIADYMHSEGCSCCRLRGHDKHAEEIAELLGVEMLRDGSGYNFHRYRGVD